MKKPKESAIGSTLSYITGILDTVIPGGVKKRAPGVVELVEWLLWTLYLEGYKDREEEE